MTGRELGGADLGVLENIAGALIRLGDLDSARTLIAGVPDWNIAADVTVSRAALQLGLNRQLRTAESIQPVHDALLKLARSCLPEFPSAAPSAYAARRLRTRIPVFSPEVTQETLRYLLATHGLTPTSLWFWHVFIDTLPDNPESRSLAFALIETALTTATDDAVRAEVIGTFGYVLDNDVPEIRERIAALITPYANPLEAPLTTARVRLFEVQTAMRQGQPVDLVAALELIPDPELKSKCDQLRLRYYTQTRDLVMLKRTVDRLSAAQLLAPSLLSEVIPALELLGRKSDASLARETAQRELKKAILNGWAEADPYDVVNALEMAEVLGAPSPFPAGWVASVGECLTSPQLQRRVRLIDAWLRQDWKGTALEAAALIQSRPAMYHYYWYQGVALARLGDKSAATTALTTYTRYAKEEAEYPAALALLKEWNGQSLTVGEQAGR